ncbi:Ataxin-10-like protein [Ooceraea biroi]|uniref:Ataxin-10-like protein n=1 Tax=Ooceraea biroi TaxID=2015173 RepID=A0A026W2E1_OOCBI|nr:Ataxin-10-like protein [Ooceraea biroi]
MRERTPSADDTPKRAPPAPSRVIPQWTILALRNLCEGNLENQEIIRNCKKEGVLDNPVLQEMGLTLHEDEDGKSIRIAPLRRN